MLYTTLNDIRDKSPCRSGWENLLKHLDKTKADDEPLSFETILNSNGVDDTLWCLRVLPSEMDGPVRHLACNFAETVLEHTHDLHLAETIHIARLYADGQANTDQFRTAQSVARSAAYDAAYSSACSAALYVVRSEAYLAVYDAAWPALHYVGSLRLIDMLREWLIAQGDK